MSVVPIQMPPPAPSPLPDDPKSSTAAVMTARSSLAGVTLLLLADASLSLPSPQGRHVDARA